MLIDTACYNVSTKLLRIFPMGYKLRHFLTVILFSLAACVCRADAMPSFIGMEQEAIPDTLARRVDLNEVVVKPKKEHYSKKNNPAVDFVNKIRDRQDITNPMSCPQYNYSVYDRITVAINEAEDGEGNLRGLLKQFPVLKEYVDTSEITGKPVLPISVKEKVTEYYHRNSPEKTREFVSAIKRIGLDAIGNEESMQMLLEDLMREIDLYQNDITLLSNRFVSPLSKIGPDFYKYYLVDTIAPLSDSDSLIVLEFAPRNSATFGFVGRIYVPKNDSTMFVQKATLYLPHKANVNFIESLRIDQEFERDSLGYRHKILDNLTVEAAVIPGTQGIYMQKYTRLLNHDFDETDPRGLFPRMGSIYTAPDAYLQPETFWDAHRDASYRNAQRNIGAMAASLRSNPWYYWTEKVLNVIVTGYVPVGKADKVEFGPVNTLVSFNDVEGTRLRFGGVTTGELNPNWFFRGYGAYGFKDHKWKYYGEAEYSFNRKKRHSREFPVRSIRASYRYDKHMIGQDYAFTNPDNIFLSFKRMDDTLAIYQRTARLEYTYEFDNHFSMNLAMEGNRQEASKYLPFEFADGGRISHIDFSTVCLTLRYAPGEKFIQTKSERIPINIDAPVIQLSHTYGPAHFLGSSRYVVNKTDIDVRKRFWFSAFGYADVTLRGGHVWSAVPFTQLFIPNANLTYTIQPESFMLLSPMEFVTDTYASWDLTYWPNGAIFNYIPFFKELKLRESFAFRGFWGRLSDKNNPAKNAWLPMFPVESNPRTITDTPYMEVGIGIDNIFKILRVEYSWRLSYRSTPGVDRSGLRIALHFNF